MPAKFDKKRKGTDMAVLTLANGGQKVFVSPHHVVAFHKSLDAAKPNVTVIYTQYQAFPFEALEEPMVIGNWVAMAKRGLTPQDAK